MCRNGENSLEKCADNYAGEKSLKRQGWHMAETPKCYVPECYIINGAKGQIGHQAVMSGKVNRIYRATLQII